MDNLNVDFTSLVDPKAGPAYVDPRLLDVMAKQTAMVGQTQRGSTQGQVPQYPTPYQDPMESLWGGVTAEGSEPTPSILTTPVPEALQEAVIPGTSIALEGRVRPLKGHEDHFAREDAANALESAIDEFRASGGNISVTSAHRSEAEQEALYQAYLAGRGNPANPPGLSAHNHGLAFDLGGDIDGFSKVAAKYGFSRPYGHEPWHFTYGGSHAEDAARNKKLKTYEGGEDSAFRDQVIVAARRKGINRPDILEKQFDAESAYNPNAVSPAGAFGLTQLMPSTAIEEAGRMGLKGVTKEQIARDTNLQIQIGVSYMQRQLREFKNYPQALAAYNAGPGAVQSWVEAAQQGGKPVVYDETRKYVSKILGVDEETAEQWIVNGPPEDKKALRYQEHFIPGAVDKNGRPILPDAITEGQKETVRSFFKQGLGSVAGLVRAPASLVGLGGIFDSLVDSDPNSDLRQGLKQSEIVFKKGLSGLTLGISNLFQRVTIDDEKFQKQWMDEYKRQGGVLSEGAFLVGSAKKSPDKAGFWDSVNSHLLNDMPTFIGIALGTSLLRGAGQAAVAGATSEVTAGAIGGLSGFYARLPVGAQKFFKFITASKTARGTMARKLLTNGFREELAFGIGVGLEAFNRTFLQNTIDRKMSPGEAASKAFVPAMVSAVEGVALGMIAHVAGGAMYITGKGAMAMGSEALQQPAFKGISEFASNAWSKIPAGVRSQLAEAGQKGWNNLGKPFKQSLDEQFGQYADLLHDTAKKEAVQLNNRAFADAAEKNAVTYDRLHSNINGVLEQADQALHHAKTRLQDKINHYKMLEQNSPNAVAMYNRSTQLRQELMDMEEALAAANAGVKRVKNTKEEKQHYKELIERLNGTKDTPGSIKAAKAELAMIDTDPDVKLVKAAHDAVGEARTGYERMKQHPIFQERESLEGLAKVADWTRQTLRNEALAARRVAGQVVDAVDPNLANNRAVDAWENISEQDQFVIDDIKDIVTNWSDFSRLTMPVEMEAEIRQVMAAADPVTRLGGLTGDGAVTRVENLRNTVQSMLKGLPKEQRKSFEASISKFEEVVDYVKASKQLDQAVMESDSFMRQNSAVLRHLFNTVSHSPGLFAAADNSAQGPGVTFLLADKEAARQRAILSVLGTEFAEKMGLVTRKERELVSDALKTGHTLVPDEDVERLIFMTDQSNANAQAVRDAVEVLAGVDDDPYVGIAQNLARNAITAHRAGEVMDTAFQRTLRNAIDGMYEVRAARPDGDPITKEAFETELADAIVNDTVEDYLQKNPDMRRAFMPFRQLELLLERHGMVSADEKAIASQLYLSEYLPRLARFNRIVDKTRYQGQSSQQLLKDVFGTVGPGRNAARTLSPSDLSPAKVAAAHQNASDAIGGTDWERFVLAEPERQKAILNKHGIVKDMDSGTRVTPKDKERIRQVVAQLLVGEANLDPASLMGKKVGALYRARAHRNITKTLMDTEVDGNRLLMHRDEAPTTYPLLSNLTATHLDRDFALEMVGRQSQLYKDLAIHPAIADHFETHLAVPLKDLTDSMAQLSRAVNSVALSGSHIPFWFGVMGNLWKSFGFNIRRTMDSMYVGRGLRKDPSWSHVLKDGMESGLDLQSVERAATGITRIGMQETRALQSELGQQALQQPGIGKAISKVFTNFVSDVADRSKNQGKLSAVGRILETIPNAVRRVDEWAMEHLLFSNIKDAQVGAWMLHSQRIMQTHGMELIAKGTPPAQAWAESKRAAARIVNTFTGTMEKWYVSHDGFKQARLMALTPQWMGSRIRSVLGAIDSKQFRDFDPATRANLQKEYAWMWAKGLAAMVISANVFQYAVSGTSTFDNAPGRELDVRIGNQYVSNPWFSFDRIINKLFPVAQAGRFVAQQTGIAQSGEGSLPPNPLGVSMRQAFNAMGPIGQLGAGAQSIARSHDPMDPMGSLGRGLQQGAASSIGAYQQVTGIDPWTGEKQESHKTMLGLMGAYASDASTEREYRDQVVQSKQSALKHLRARVTTMLKEARHAANRGDVGHARQLYEKAWQEADPHGEYKDGGMALSKKLAAELAKDGSVKGGRLRLTPDQFQNLVDMVTVPEQYYLKQTPNALREQQLKTAAVRQQQRQEMEEVVPTNALNAPLRAIDNTWQ